MDTSWKAMPCLEWEGPVFPNGYGYLRGKKARKTVYAHRMVWEECYDILQPGDVVAHHCDNPKCIQPLHLFKTTAKGNVDDMWEKGRNHGNYEYQRTQTHCKQGHPFDEQNTRYTKQYGKRGTTMRVCRMCARQNTQACRDRARKLT